MRQHAAAAAAVADLPKPPHLAKETAAAVANGCAAARRADAAAAGHLMQESAMGSEFLSGSCLPWRRRGGDDQLDTGRGGAGFYRGYRRGGERAEEERRPGLLRSPRGSREEGRLQLREIKKYNTLRGGCLLPPLRASVAAARVKNARAVCTFRLLAATVGPRVAVGPWPGSAVWVSGSVLVVTSFLFPP